MIRVAIFTISDTASKDAAADKSGPTIRQILIDKGFHCAPPIIIPDDETQIRDAVNSSSQSGEVDWIITTGGTGFGARDRTPEAISPLFDRQAPGLVHLLLSSSINHTPLAALSRPVAGTIKNTLVVTFPGSVKAVKENMEALLNGGVVEHAIELIRGGSGKAVHADLAAGGSGLGLAHVHSHHGHHHSHQPPQPRTTLSHDPSLPVSTRHRISPYPLITPSAALQSIFSVLKPLPTRKLPVTHALTGHVLAEDIYAPENVPPTPTTNVDGYALRSTDPPGIYTVLTPQTHPRLSIPIPEGSIYRINTGAPLPAGTDTVIMVEDTKLVSTVDASAEEHQVGTLAQIPVGENIRKPGSDVRKGDLVLEKGEILRSVGGEIGTLVFVGRKEVEVYTKPVVALMSTGNEILDSQTLRHENGGDGEWGGIWDTNRPSLRAALEGMGYGVVDLGVIPDSIPAHISALKKGLSTSNLILTTGGTSMGPSDLLKPVIERNIGGTVHFGRVSAKPGKPTTFATAPVSEKEGDDAARMPIFALPGNPASALVMFHIFVVPALRKLGGWADEKCELPRVRVKLRTTMPLDPRTEFHRVVIRASATGLEAFSTGGQRSSRVASLSGANGLVVLPPRQAEKGAKKEMREGEEAEAVVIGEISM